MVRYDFRYRYQSVTEVLEDLEKLNPTISSMLVNESMSNRIYSKKIVLAGLYG